ncbi:MAG: hypothetical protein MJD61_13475 [Proteobacteria bacterium]|nr:hypothetical protein [Pseudomonadota bacterium]
MPTLLPGFARGCSDWNRCRSDSIVSERALREIYFLAFKTAIGAGAKAVMTSYNKINGTYAGHNKWLITEVFRGDWVFEGIVMSDWDSIYSAKEAFESGLDQECPKLSLKPGEAEDVRA